MSIRSIQRHEARISIRAEPEIVPIEGNAMASGDDAFDAQVESGIRERLNQGDIWAWAAVEVKATWKVFRGTACLGCCSYESEEDFRQPDGYFDDLLNEALEDLNREVAEAHQNLHELAI